MYYDPGVGKFVCVKINVCACCVCVWDMSMFPPKPHHGITVKIVCKECVGSVEADKYSYKRISLPLIQTRPESSTERVGEGDFFHQINIAQFKVNCDFFSKQHSIYEHNIPQLSFDFNIPSAMSGSMCVCTYVCTYKYVGSKIRIYCPNMCICPCVLVNIKIYCTVCLCVCVSVSARHVRVCLPTCMCVCALPYICLSVSICVLAPRVSVHAPVRV